jgi:general secretion pathway protein K
MRKPGERGVALLTVLLLVAVMSVIAVGVLDDIRFGIRREANAETVGQAQWYALGAEALARERMSRLIAPQNQRGAEDWNGRWLSFSIDGGAIQTRLSDAGVCFNLNSVVQGAPEQWSRRDLGLAQFTALLRALDVGQGEAAALPEALADWIDSDGARNTLGAEDDTYTNGAFSYRTSGALLSEVSELRAIRGFTPDIYARIRPFVCALPTADLSPINLNLLTPDKAMLLSMLTDGALDLTAARRVIAARPANGWTSVGEFWNAPVFKEHLPPDAVLDQVTLQTRFVALEADVTYGGSDVVLTSLFERSAAGPIRLTGRRWGVEE